METKTKLAEDTLASLIVTLKALQTAALPPSTGSALHGLVLALARQSDVSEAKKWHDGKEFKPFSISPLMGRLARSTVGSLVVKDKYYWFKIGLIGRKAFDVLCDSLLPLAAKTEKLPISNLTFTVEKVDMCEHHLAKLTSFTDIFRGNNHKGQEINLQFLSPTTFRRGRKNRILPDPELVFGSLLRKWNYFSPQPLDINLEEVCQHVVISKFSGRSKLYRLPTQPLVGFQGRCSYISDRKELLLSLYKLAEFGLYAGVGQKTTMGMGQIRHLAT
jgi:CRISPR-associated endoribonuclease Cas6